MERVIGSYMELFGTAVEQEDFDKAAGYLTKIRELHPDSPVLEAGEQNLAAARQARADRLAEQERQRQAEEAARQAELERQRIAQEIEAHWSAFEAALEEGKDLDEATNSLAEVRNLNPDEPGLAPAEQRLEAATGGTGAQAPGSRRETERISRRHGLHPRRHVPHGRYEWGWSG